MQTVERRMLEQFAQVHPLLALGVLASTAATDAVYVLFTAAVSGHKRLAAASWSSVWYLLSAFAVITYTKNWSYVCFAALGSFAGAYVSMTLLHGPRRGDPVAPVVAGDHPSTGSG